MLHSDFTRGSGFLLTLSKNSSPVSPLPRLGAERQIKMHISNFRVFPAVFANSHLFTAPSVYIVHVWKVNVQMLTELKFAYRDKRVPGNINNFKRPSLRLDIYRVGGGGTLERPPSPSLPRDTLAEAEE